MTNSRSRSKSRPSSRFVIPTRDIHPEWLNIVRRLQSVGKHKQRGLAVLTIKVMVDAEGHPCRLWGDPVVTKLEPCNGVQEEIGRILDGYTDEERQMVLAALIDTLGRER